jgi:hypothetical protein
MLVSGALACTELAWWEPAKGMSADIQRYTVSPRENIIEEFRDLGKAGLSLRLQGSVGFVTKTLIVSTRWHRLAALSRVNDDLFRAMNIGGELRSDRALCGLRLRVEPQGIPCTVRPLTVLFDTDDIPDVDTEAWPVTLKPAGQERELALWASVNRHLSLDEVLDQFRHGMARLGRTFPFLKQSLVSLSVPLSMDTCFDDEARTRSLDTVENALIENYDYTSLQTQTRLPSLHALLPSNGCHFPFPIGPLHAAKRVLTDIVGKKRLALSEQQPTLSAPPSPA